ncbi:hypothetical protein HHK36_031068 [Tetracentron sinense]|uniref:Uncharacterized protein n=1 Tax=Tetracentron sinense TaxID=13715 RepID=A0A834YAW8_TETSI|nr:hypothetical protein HHK36_031068 [Tetracentron sinense]
MGRAPCCDKANVKKGPWSPEEDAKLKAYIEQHGTGGNWIALPQKIGTSYKSTFWQDLPVPVPVPLPYLNKETNSNDHAAIKKLLIKLGGRFSHEDQQPDHKVTNLQCPLDISSAQKLNENSINMISSSAPMNSLNNTCSQLQNIQYNVMDEGAGMHMMQGFDSFPVEADEMFYFNPQGLDGVMQYLYGVEMVNSSTGTNSAESTSWGDIRSLVYPPIVSNYQGCEQGMLQECAFEESRYLESQ